MSQAIVYLKFPTLQAFLEYVKAYSNQGIIGIVIRRQIYKHSRVRWFIRLTKFDRWDLPSPSRILVCDIEFFNDMYYNGYEEKEKLNELKDAKLKEMKDAIHEQLDSPSWTMKTAQAEFQLSADD